MQLCKLSYLRNMRSNLEKISISIMILCCVHNSLNSCLYDQISHGNKSLLCVPKSEMECFETSQFIKELQSSMNYQESTEKIHLLKFFEVN